MIKYRFALNSKGDIIDVESLTKTLKAKEKYYTIDYHQELFPKLGEINVKHFALKSSKNQLGNKETYLHALGKKVFIQEYQHSLSNNLPFFIEYATKPICKRLEHKLGFKCHLNPKTELFDLTKRFKIIHEEKRDDKFIPDILLTDEKGIEKIYIEIAVTHFLSDEKRDSNKRIIEIELTDDSDVNEIIKLKKGIFSHLVNYYGFKSKTIQKNPCSLGECEKEFFQFFVKENGKSIMLVVKEKELKFENPMNTVYSKIKPKNWNSDGSDIYKKFVAKAFNENVKIKNCFLCKYHADNNSFMEDSPPIFCKFHKKSGNSNMAADCSIFKAHKPYIDSYL